MNEQIFIFAVFSTIYGFLLTRKAWQNRGRWLIPKWTMPGFVAFCCATTWFVGYNLKWIRERHDALETLSSVLLVRSLVDSYGKSAMSHAPITLRLLGERGVGAITATAVCDPAKVERLRRLFPEAIIIQLPPRTPPAQVPQMGQPLLDDSPPPEIRSI